MLVEFECEHMKACQSCRGAKFGKKHMAAAQVNDKAIKKLLKIPIKFLWEYVKAWTIEIVKMLIKY